MKTTMAGLVVLVFVLGCVLFWAIEARGGALERAARADSTAAAHATAALEAERARQVSDSAGLAVEAALRDTLTRRERSLVSSRRRTDSLLALVSQPGREIPPDSLIPHPATLEAIIGAVMTERAACDATLATCSQLRAAAELRAATADSSARRLEVALVNVEARWQVALRKARRGPIRRGAEAVALAGCVVAGAGIGVRDIGLATLIGGGFCLLELVF
jgi:hypothetical protein